MRRSSVPFAVNSEVFRCLDRRSFPHAGRRELSACKQVADAEGLTWDVRARGGVRFDSPPAPLSLSLSLGERLSAFAAASHVNCMIQTTYDNARARAPAVRTLCNTCAGWRERERKSAEQCAAENQLMKSSKVRARERERECGGRSTAEWPFHPD